MNFLKCHGNFRTHIPVVTCLLLGIDFGNKPVSNTTASSNLPNHVKWRSVKGQGMLRVGSGGEVWFTPHMCHFLCNIFKTSCIYALYQRVDPIMYAIGHQNCFLPPLWHIKMASIWQNYHKFWHNYVILEKKCFIIIIFSLSLHFLFSKPNETYIQPLSRVPYLQHLHKGN